MMKVVPLTKQIKSMKRDFPFIKISSDYEFHVKFPDYPLYQYKIELAKDYPKSKPTITRDDKPIRIPIITYWLQTCTLSNIVQNLYLISVSNFNPPLIPPPSLSPPTVKTVPSLISPFETKNKNEKSPALFISSPVCQSIDKKVDENECTECTELFDCSEFSEISYIIQNENKIQKTGDAYTDSINILKQKFRKKEISFNQFMAEFQRLQSLKDKHDV